MKAWGKSLDASSKNIRFLGDATGAFTKAWEVAFDATAFLGNERSKRYAIQTEDGKVTSVAVEPDNTGITSKIASQDP
jgi:peroxiredoxin 5